MSLSFHPFNRWVAIAIDGEPVGYISHFDEKSALHLSKGAPQWLKDVRTKGPFATNYHCQVAIRAAMTSAHMPRDLVERMEIANGSVIRFVGGAGKIKSSDGAISIRILDEIT